VVSDGTAGREINRTESRRILRKAAQRLCFCELIP
jgi:hypothetical protein